MGCCANLGGGRSQSGDGFEVEQVVVLSAVLSSLHMLWNRSLHDVISPSNQDHPTTHPTFSPRPPPRSRWPDGLGGLLPCQNLHRP